MKKAEDTTHKQSRTRTTPMTGLLVNTPVQDESLLHGLEQAASGIGFHANVNMTEYKCFYQGGDIYTLNGSSLKLVDKFTY